jgi:hypothetical protein
MVVVIMVVKEASGFLYFREIMVVEAGGLIEERMVPSV